jgi:hypothetical protein
MLSETLLVATKVIAADPWPGPFGQNIPHCLHSKYVDLTLGLAPKNANTLLLLLLGAPVSDISVLIYGFKHIYLCDVLNDVGYDVRTLVVELLNTKSPGYILL